MKNVQYSLKNGSDAELDHDNWSLPKINNPQILKVHSIAYSSLVAEGRPDHVQRMRRRFHKESNDGKSFLAAACL